MVKRRSYAPDRGDLVWLTFDPQAGHEQRGRRPALAISPKAYNQLVGLALFCPIRSAVKGYPFEVALPAKGRVTGVVLADQIRSLDWNARRVEFAARAPEGVVDEVAAKLRTLI